MEDSNHKRKRVPDHSDSPDSKIPRLHSSHSDLNSPHSQPARVDSLLDSDVQLQDHIFNILDDADNVPERDSVQGLDSVIKSFEDEINAPTSDPGSDDPTRMVDPSEIQTNLGYLLEASDDELGLPPTVSSGEGPGRVDPDVINGPVGFEDDFPGYDAFGFGFTAECEGGGAGVVTVDGLFDYAEPAADVLWWSESLQAM